jgi:exodeoxyribonuclease III
VRVVTWNVNSLNARVPRLLQLLEQLAPDVVLLQETKCTPEQFPHLELQAAGYDAADHSAGRWNGVAVLARRDLDLGDVTAGLPGEPDPSEARYLEATAGGVRFASVYVPNGRVVGSPFYEDKLAFLDALVERVAALRAGGGPLVVAGDMNVAPADLDVYDPAAFATSTHVTPAERSRIARMVDLGMVDAFRGCVADEPGFTWWDYRAGHFHKGFGLRIDLILVSADHPVRACRVLRDFRKLDRPKGDKPSDHAPLLAELG